MHRARSEWLERGARLRVDQVAEHVTANAAMTWDYTAYVLCASSIASIGLATSSIVAVLASMLVSPIMGPVLSVTFGTAFRSKSMVKIGLRNELLSLAMCVFVGMFWSIIATVAGVDETRDWPTDEMLARGDYTGLVSGILIALFSGVATAVSTLGNNSNGLTGVAISLSLLPPAVNGGICWMYSILLASGAAGRNPGDNEQYGELGTISFALTITNIVCIWIAGVFTLWLKEVAPYKKKNAFWSRDIAIYRKPEKSSVDIETINDGIKAMMELREAAGNNV